MIKQPFILTVAGSDLFIVEKAAYSSACCGSPSPELMKAVYKNQCLWTATWEINQATLQGEA